MQVEMANSAPGVKWAAAGRNQVGFLHHVLIRSKALDEATTRSSPGTKTWHVLDSGWWEKK